MELDEVYNLADSLGLIVDSFVLDGQWHTVKATNGKKTKKSGTYCLSELMLKSGKSAIVGMLFNWLTGEAERVTLDSENDVTAEELTEARQRAKQAAEEGKKARRRLQQETAERALSIWNKLPDSGKSEYLTRKKVKAWGLRFSRGSIVVPARDEKGKIWTLQFIDPEGNKRFLTGGAKRGRFHLIGIPKGQLPVIGIAEGYATAATVYESKHWPMAVAFDAGNLLPVAKAIRKVYPKSRLLLCSDMDIYNGYPQAFIKFSEVTPAVKNVIVKLRYARPDVQVEIVSDDDPRLKDRTKSSNQGLECAIHAAAAVDGDVIVPMIKLKQESKNEDSRRISQ